jgi:hypothetical protein
VRKVGEIACGCVACAYRAFQKPQGGVLESGVLIGVLQEQPRAVRPFIADEPPSRPTMFREDKPHPFEVSH